MMEKRGVVDSDSPSVLGGKRRRPAEWDGEPVDEKQLGALREKKAALDPGAIETKHETQKRD